MFFLRTKLQKKSILHKKIVHCYLAMDGLRILVVFETVNGYADIKKIT